MYTFNALMFEEIKHTKPVIDSYIEGTDRRPINITTCKNYYGNTKTVFFLQNNFFSAPPFKSYEIINNYDKTNILIKDKGEQQDELIDGGSKKWHDFFFKRNGRYEIQIKDLRTELIHTLVFTIS